MKASGIAGCPALVIYTAAQHTERTKRLLLFMMVTGTHLCNWVDCSALSALGVTGRRVKRNSDRARTSRVAISSGRSEGGMRSTNTSGH